MKKKVLILAMALSAFCLMAIGSGSSSSSETSVRIEPESENSSDSEYYVAEETATVEEANMAYEITDTGFEYYVNSINKTEYYGFVEIENTGNVDIYLKDCVFDLEDNDGHLLQSDDFIYNAPDVIRPGEKGYFFNSLGSSYIDDNVSFDNGINLVPQLTLVEATGMPDYYEISDLSYSEGSYGYLKVVGRATNNTDDDCGLASLYIIFYDADGKVLSIDSSSLSDLNAGSTKSFDVSVMFGNDNVTINDIADCKVIAQDLYMQF